MGGEDSDPDKNISEGYWTPDGEKEKAEASKVGVVLAGIFEVAKIKEAALIAPIVFLFDWLGVSDLFKKKKDKRSATSKKHNWR